jgi:phage shock protein A
VNNVQERNAAMFKTIATLLRGKTAEAGEGLADDHALTILFQQLRDCAAALARAKTALALTIAQGNAESRRLDELDARIADLELRVRAALASKQDGLARTGATAIATLEEERAAAKNSAVAFEQQIATLRVAVANFETRLIDLERGRKLATVERRLRDARIGAADGDIVRSGLKEAEATLEKIRSRHALERDSDTALLTIEPSSANAVAERLAAAGCGPKLRIDADDVLRRLQLELPAPDAA